jgi:hypothetical protein
MPIQVQVDSRPIQVTVDSRPIQVRAVVGQPFSVNLSGLANDYDAVAKRLTFNDARAATSAGGVLESNNGTLCLTWGAGGGSNLTAAGGLTAQGLLAASAGQTISGGTTAAPANATSIDLRGGNVRAGGYVDAPELRWGGTSLLARANTWSGVNTFAANTSIGTTADLGRLGVKGGSAPGTPLGDEVRISNGVGAFGSHIVLQGGRSLGDITCLGNSSILRISPGSVSNSPAIQIFGSTSTTLPNNFFISSNRITFVQSNSTGTDVTFIPNIPTSATGLPSGALWNDAGTVKVA